MIRIPLANGKGIALIDDDDGGRIPLTGWHRHNGGYAQHRACRADGQHTHVLLHRLVVNAQPGDEVDHINHDRLDCRRANLRFVTRSQNNQNWPGPQSTNRLGVRGASAYATTAGTRYRAGVQVGGKRVARWGLCSIEEADLVAKELRRTHCTHSPENRE